MDWQPIETAPRDGASVIGLLANGEVFRIQWHVGGWWIASDIDVTSNPTHWMPLPPPPQEPTA